MKFLHIVTLVAFLSASNAALIMAYSPEEDEDEDMTSLQMKYMTEEEDEDDCGSCA